ncbi:MAG: PD-(D/E)XK nuclease family protein [Elusimicrobia bacterium]|nr:PD-(D/E)XK nuclease family protein [Elusimicrobiota bacterium]
MPKIKLPRPLSHSSLTMYGECPQKYKFKYIDNIPEKPRHFFSFGSSVHQALEFFYGVKTLPPPSLEELLAYYKEHWLSAGYRDQVQESEYFDDGKQILTQFYNKHVRDFKLPFFVEYQFNLEVSGVPVTGKVDRIDKLADGSLSILDYKTGKALAKDRVQADAQLTMYQMACEALLGLPVARLVFYHLPTLKEQSVERHQEGLVAALRERIVSAAEAISEGAFTPKPEEKKCYWCDYKPLCPIFKHQFPGTEPALPRGRPASEESLGSLIDRYGELSQKSAELEEERARLQEKIIALLEEKGYVRAFGQRYQLSSTSNARWSFSDKKKVLELIKKAGLYERILAPSAPKVEQLMSDPELDLNLKAQLEELGEKTEAWEIKVQPL